MCGQIGRMSDFDGAGQLKMRDVGIGPDNFRPVDGVEIFDAFAGIACNEAERIDCIGQYARQYLQGVIGSPWRALTLVAPPPDHRPDLFRPVELRNTKTTKVLRDPIKPRPPLPPRTLGKPPVAAARLVERHHRSEPRLVRSAPTFMRLIE